MYCGCLTIYVNIAKSRYFFLLILTKNALSQKKLESDSVSACSSTELLAIAVSDKRIQR